MTLSMAGVSCEPALSQGSVLPGYALMEGGEFCVQAVQGVQIPPHMSQVSLSSVAPPQMVWVQPDAAASSALGMMPATGMVPVTGTVPCFPVEQLMVQPQQLQLTTVFFAGVTPIVDASQLLSVFAQFGRVMDLNLFRPYKGCRTSKGCGLVVFSQHSEAAAALETLNGRFVWPGARSPMVIEWCDPNKQHKRKRAQPLAPALLQQMMGFQQQAIPCIPTAMMPAAPASLGYMPTSNAGRLMMPGC